MFKFVVSRPILFSMIFIAFTIGGIFGFFQLKVDLLPTVNLPIISVTVVSPGMGPKDVEQLITKKLESVFSDLASLKSVKSISAEGYTFLLIEFKYGEVEINSAAIDVQQRINEIRSELPVSIEEPLIRKMDPATRPIMTLTLSGRNVDLRDLRDFAETRLKPRIERVDNVARVFVNGGYIRQINVDVDQKKAASLGISLRDISGVLKRHNSNVPAGTLKMEKRSELVNSRTMAQFNSIFQIRDLIVRNVAGFPIALKDVAAVTDTYKEPRGFASLNGTPAIILEVKKQTGTNTNEISKSLHELFGTIKKELPEGMELIIAKDDSEFIKDAINGIKDAAWQGFILAFISIIFLMGTIPPTVVIFISVPISIISTFLVMWLGGMTINMVTLYALTISIGVNFDASVVVLENIFRHMQQGKTRIQASIDGVSELGAPLFASTLTNVIVFIPLTQLVGYIGELMRAMAITAIFSQFMALPVALFFTSNITPRIVRSAKEDDVTSVPILRQLVMLTTLGVKTIRWTYEKTLRVMLRFKYTSVFLILLLFIASFGLVPFIGVEFMPRTDQNSYFLDIEAPEDYSLEATKKIALEVENIIKKYKEVEFVVTSIGGDQPSSPPENRISISLKLVSRTKRKKTAIDTGNQETDIISSLRHEIQTNVSGIKYMQFVQPAPWWGSAGAPVEIKLKGFDWYELNRIGDEYIANLKGLKGVFDVMKNTRSGKMEYRIELNEKKMSEFGIDVGALSEALRLGVNGGDISVYRTEFRTEAIFRDKDIFIITRFRKEDRKNIEDLKYVLIPTSSGSSVPLSTIADFRLTRGEGFITKEDKARQVVITIQTSDEPLNELIFKRIMPAINKVTLPDGVSMSIGGEVTRMNDQVWGMSIGFTIAFLFVFMVLAGQFESLIHPIVMLAAIPVMMIGVFAALFLTGNTLNTTSGNGIFALLGVVVNTSVILIDYINQLRREGEDIVEALVKAGSIRMRPILMTVLTTFLAMLPMAVSNVEGSDVYKPLAIAFMGGLVTSTFLTLYFVPLLYLIAERFRWKEQDQQ